MKILHWIVLITALLVSLLMWLPMYIIRNVFIHSLMVASEASEKALGLKIDLPKE
jgi:hypothetical protein